MAYVPDALGILIVLPLLTMKWPRPRPTLVMLTLYILVIVALSTWDFVIKINVPKAEDMALEDSALAITYHYPPCFYPYSAHRILQS
nr:hypothetical protein L204_03882 [Cryptococcus depauperatus CBS 7855]